MSARLNTARVSKRRWKKFSADVRRVYLEESWPVRDFRDEIARGAKYSEAMKILNPHEHYVELQLFDEGRTWLVRPLEVGWFFMNHVWEGAWDSFGVVPVCYNDSSEPPLEDLPNKAVGEWLDERVRAREYLLYPVLDRFTYSMIYSEGRLKG